MGCENIRKREEELLKIALSELSGINGIKILANNIKDRLGVISFYIEGIHHNLVTKLLNDLYGIQVRGGCSCAGTYGHYLLHVDQNTSNAITDAISHGDLSAKPGWIRMSLHPTMTNEEVLYLLESVKTLAEKFPEWEKDYEYSSKTNEYAFREVDFARNQQASIEAIFDHPLT